MIPRSFFNDGYAIVPSNLEDETISLLQQEAQQLAKREDSSCVRNIRSKSAIVRALTISEILPPNFIPVRSILFDKTPQENWPVAWHQDLTIAVSAMLDIPEYGPWSKKDGVPHVQPPLSLLEKMITVRLHLDDTPAKNGALRVIPESHTLGKIPSDQVNQHTQTDYHVCECVIGDLLLMSPLILHASSRSKSPSHRRIIHLEFAPADSLHPDLRWHEQFTG